MNFRRRAKPEVFGFQIAPMVDILLVLLVFFIVTWNFALSENELDVKIPSASKSQEQRPYLGQVVVNVRADGTIVFQRKPISGPGLLQKLQELAKLFPDQAVILRGDQRVDYKHIVDVLDICRTANIWNVAFATGKSE
ncbi:MAG: biopolymer transport protein ExbD [Chthoniobacter sp.]|jgi:biopolymer transport protein ExbD|nr:biopolymer transport protein ExbD [Chthoniobacter sp.]